MVEDVRGGVPNVEKNAKQRAMLSVRIHAPAQGFGVFERSERAIDPADHFTEGDFLWRPFQLVAAMGAPEADHNAGALEFEQYRLQKLFGQLFLGGDVLDLDDGIGMLREHRKCLQSVQSSL